MNKTIKTNKETDELENSQEVFSARSVDRITEESKPLNQQSKSPAAESTNHCPYFLRSR